MTWVRKDDQMPIHRKVAPLSDAAYRLHDEAICWSSRNLTDGAIAEDELADISKRGRPKVADELVTRRLWHAAGGECASSKCPPAGPNGWVIHDYWDYQPSREKVLREKEEKAKRQRRWIEAKKRGRSASGDASADASDPPSSDASGDAAPRDANPAPPPPRPEGSGVGDPPRATAARRSAAGPAGGGRTKPSDRHPPSTNGHDPDNPDWRTRPAFGTPREPDDAERALAGAAAVRAQIRRPPAPPARNALDELRAATPEIPIPDQPTEATDAQP